MDQKSIGVITLFLAATLSLLAIPAGAMTTQGVDVHGFISQGFLYSDEYNYLAHNSTDGSFEYNEFGINFSKNLTDRLRMGMQLFSRDLGDASNNKVTLDWAYGDYRFKDWLGIRAGRVKLPMGLYNETRDLDMLRTCIVLPQGIYNELLRDNLIAINGVGIYGNVDLGSAGGLEYQAVTGAIYADAESGVGKWGDDGVDEYGGETVGDMENDTAFAGAIRWETPLSGLRVGYSFYKTKPTTQIRFGGTTLVAPLEVTNKQHVGSAEFVWNELTVAAEYMLRYFGADFGSIALDLEMEGYYLSASYGFTDWFALGVYYSIYYEDRDDKNGDNKPIDHLAWDKDLALTLRFNINEYWIVKIEGHAVDGTANVINLDNSDNDFGDPDWCDDFSESDWYYGAAKVTFSF